MANSAEFSVIIDVVTKNLKQAIKEVEGLGAAVNSTGTKHKEAAKEANSHYNAQEKGIIGTANSTKSFSKLAETLGSGSSGLVGAYATLAANAFAVSAAFNALRSAAGAQALLEGLETQGARTGRTLTLTADAVKEITGAAVSSAEAMQATAQFTASGFSGEQLKAVTQVATDASKALGRNLPDSLDRLIKGTSKLEPELLDELGIMTKLSESTAKYALENNKTVSSLTSFERKQAFLNSVIEEGTLKFAGISDKVDANPYDKLASSFDDLTKSILKVVNVALKPLVAVFSSNQVALLGAVTLFLSSIKGQLIPGLNQVAEATKKYSLEQQTAAAKELETLGTLRSGRRVAYNEYVSALSKQSATEEQYAAAVKERHDAEKAITERAVSRGFTEETRAKQLKDNKTKLESLTAAYNINAKAVVAAAHANAMESASSITLFNVKSKLSEVIKYSGQEWTALAGTVQKTEQGTISYTGSLQLLGKRALLVGKILSVTFLQMLPAIGLAVTAIGILVDLYDRFIRSDTDKKKQKAMEDLAAVTENVSKSIEEYNRIAKTSASLANRTSELLINQANSAVELATAYEKAFIKVKELNAEQLKTQKPTGSFLSKEEIDKAAAARELGISSSSMALKAFAPELTNLGNTGTWLGSIFGGFSKSVQLSIKTLDQLNQVAPETVDEFMALNGGLEKFSRLSADARQQKLLELASKVKTRFEKVVPAINAVNEAFKQAETSTAEFLKSAIQTTPFDKMVESFNNLDSALYELKAAGATTKDTVALITGIGPELQKFLTPDNSKFIESVKLADSVVQKLEERVRAGDKLNTSETKSLNINKNILASAKSQLPVLERDLELKQAQFTAAQGIARQAAAQVNLIQAIMTKNAEAYTAGAAGEKAKIAREEQMAALQAAGLKAQKALIDAAILEQNIKLRQLEIDYKTLQNDNARLLVQEKLTLQAAKQAAIFSNIPISGGTFVYADADKQATATNLQKAQEAVTASKEKEAQAAHDIEMQQRSIKDLQDASYTLSTQIAAIFASNLTEAQKAARYKEAELKLTEQETGILNKNKTLVAQLTRGQEKLNEIVQGRGESLESRLADINAAFTAETTTAVSKFNSEIETLEARFQTVSADWAAASGLEKDAYKRLLANISLNIEAKKEERRLTKESIEQTNVKNQLEAIGLNTTEQRMGKLKESLSYIQAQVDASKALLESELAIKNAQMDLAAKKGGYDISGSKTLTRKKEIEAAETAYNIAKSEVDLKVALITLEFALLDSKRMQAADDINTARIITKEKLEQAKKAGASPEIIAALQEQVDTASTILTTLGVKTSEEGSNIITSYGEGFSQLLKDQVAVIENGLKSAALVLETTKAKGPRVEEGFVSQYKQAKDEGPLDTMDKAVGALDSHISRMKESLQALGPQGELVLAVMEGASNMTKSFQDLGEALKSHDLGSSIAAGLEVASQALSVVGGILKSTSDAKIANIDREIAAEQKRDGKSSESIAKIEALEKKKDGIARKAFNTQKKLMMAQAVMSTAAAIAMTLGQGGMFAIPIAAMIGAMGLAQVAIIAGTQYQSSAAPSAAAMPTTLSIGKRDNSVDLARGPNANAGGEVGYLRGGTGTGSNASNYNTVGSAYGGELMRGYGNRGFVVGEKGPEVITPDTPITVTPADKVQQGQPINANISIQALDASDVKRVLVDQRGNIIQMLREAANASGKGFMEDVNVNVYSRPNVGRL